MINNFNNIDSLVALGQMEKAQKFVLDLVQHKLNRNETLEVAQLARRTALWNVAFRLLHPIVRPGPKKIFHPSVEEKAEYASNLIRLGAAPEGMDLLNSLAEEKYPSINLFKAYGYFTTWEYGKAIPVLESYLRAPNLSNFEMSIGKVNLAAAYVFEHWDEKAEILLKELLSDTKKYEYWRLFGNVLELSAQFAINQKDWKKADTILNESEKVLATSGGLDLLFTRKWSAVSQALRKPGNKKALIPLKKIQSEALKLKHWETVRDCDLFLGAAEPNPDKLVRLFYGTPYEKYRQRIFEYCKFPLEIPAHYLFTKTMGDKAKIILDMSSGEFQGIKLNLMPGQMPLKLFKVLSSDFYRPFRLPVLHSELYPGEYFNPNSSPLRVHQALSRFRKFLKESGLKAQVHLEGTSYRLQLSSPFAILLPKNPSEQTIQSKRLSQLKQFFSNREFSVNEVQKLFDCSPRTAQRIMQECMETGMLDRIGASSSTQYRLSRFGK